MSMKNVEYRRFGTGAILFKLDLGLGIPRKSDRVVWNDSDGETTVYEVINVFWYKDPNNEAVVVTLQQE